ncbi:MAG: F0F1 ATP synthase subunit B [Clostridia bacterium]|nr:F0F1 ATP synthase subunit B [Clostridia bacterium]
MTINVQTIQALPVISINVWSILISLANLFILYRLVRRFLFKPVKKVLDARKAELEGRYAAAEQAEQDALADKAAWSEKMAGAQAEADGILHRAVSDAKLSSEAIIASAKEQAEGIVASAEEEARLERRKAEAGIRQELVGVSTSLAEKLLGREINASDHQALIDSFIEELGDSSDGSN